MEEMSSNQFLEFQQEGIVGFILIQQNTPTSIGGEMNAVLFFSI